MAGNLDKHLHQAGIRRQITRQGSGGIFLAAPNPVIQHGLNPVNRIAEGNTPPKT